MSTLSGEATLPFSVLSPISVKEFASPHGANSYPSRKGKNLHHVEMGILSFKSCRHFGRTESSVRNEHEVTKVVSLYKHGDVPNHLYNILFCISCFVVNKINL